MKKLLGIAIIAVGIALIGGNAWADDMGKASPALKVAPGSKAEEHNAKGVERYNNKDWKEAQKHFMEAVKADGQAAETHYNLALALDKLGDHKAATEHFKMALDLGKNNPEIQDSKILKAHLKMK